MDNILEKKVVDLRDIELDRSCYLYNPNLSFEAIGLYATILNQGNDFNITPKNLQELTPVDPIEVVYKALDELISNGYLKIVNN